MTRRAYEDVRRALGPLDPSGGEEPLTTASEREATRLAILSTARTAADSRPGRRGRPVYRRNARRLLFAATTTIVGVVVVLLVTTMIRPIPRPAHAATPTPLGYHNPTGSAEAPALLEQIAARAERSALPPDGRYEYLRIQSWSLTTRIDGRQVVSAVIPEARESWRAPDDSGRVVVRHLEPVFQSEDDREIWEEQGSPGKDSGTDVDRYAPGSFPAMWSDKPPSDITALKPWLRKGHPPENGPAETIVAITDLARERVVGPDTRAALLRILAGLPGLEYDGVVEDRDGRRGQAFSIESDHTGLLTRHTLIVQPDTGRLLGYEQTLTEDAGALNVRIPAVIGYEIYQQATYVDELPE